MVFVRMLPTILLGSLVGAVAERVDRRHFLLVGLGAMCINSLVLSALAWSAVLELWHIGLGAFLSGVYWSAEHPVRRTLLAEIAGLERVGNAASLDSATNHATRILGPLLGGVLYQTLGMLGVYLLGAVLFAIAFANVATLRFEPRIGTATGGNLWASIAEGLAHIRANRLIAATLAVTVIMNFFCFPYVAMLLVIGQRRLDLGPVEIGALMSMDGLGALAGSIVLALLVRPAHFTRVYLGGAVLLLTMVLGFSASRWVELSAALLLVGGLGVAGFGAMQSAILLSRAPEELRTRLMGVLVVCIGAGPIGVLHLGLLAQWLGAATAVGVSAAEGLLALCLAAYVWPELRGASRT